MTEIIEVELTKEEKTERKQWAKEQKDKEASEVLKLELKASALAKLEKMGITQEELSALLG